MRYNDSYLNNYYRDQLSILKGYESDLGTLGELADIFNDLEGTGISDSFNKFFEAVNNLQEYPASSTARVNFIETAKTLTKTLNAKSQGLDELTSKVLGDGENQELLENSKLYNEFFVFNDKLKELIIYYTSPEQEYFDLQQFIGKESIKIPRLILDVNGKSDYRFFLNESQRKFKNRT